MRPNPLAPWELRFGDLCVYFDRRHRARTLVVVLAVGVKERRPFGSERRSSSCEDAGAPKRRRVGRDLCRRCEEGSRHLHGQGGSGRRARSGDQRRSGNAFTRLEPPVFSDDCPIPSCLEGQGRRLRRGSPAAALAASKETTVFFLRRAAGDNTDRAAAPSRIRQLLVGID
jgi:hypothetical protein